VDGGRDAGDGRTGDARDDAARRDRERARPFKNKTELVSKKLLSDEQYRKVKDLLTAKQPPKPAAK
jgi:hypothetical protein